MKTFVFLFSTVFLLTAQVRLHCQGGVSASSIWGNTGSAAKTFVDDSYGYHVLKNFSPSLLTKPTWGISTEVPIKGKSSAIFGIVLVQKGLSWEYNNSSDASNFYQFNWFKQVWLEIPFLYNYNIYQYKRFALDVQGGVWGAVRLHSEEYSSLKQNGSLKMAVVSKESVISKENAFFTPLSSFDMGVQIGCPLSFRFGKRMEFSLTPSYSLGFVPQISYNDERPIILPDQMDAVVMDTVYLTGGKNQYHDFRILGGISIPLGR